MDDKSRSEVIRLLGPPDRGGPIDPSDVALSEAAEGASELLRYELGGCGGTGRCLFEEETEYLDVYLDSDGGVQSVERFWT